VDISSILSFATLLSAFIPTRFFDFRPAPLHLEGLTCGAADLTGLPFADRSLASLSCMHVIEHIGLGRYGDPLDPDGDLKAIGELVRVLAPGGNLLVATPVGQPRVQFNAHRVYDHEAFARAFAPLELVEFALIEESGERGLIVSPDPALVRAQAYGCGCFWFRRPG
jgi:SAM-dependent methyltransferase